MPSSKRGEVDPARLQTGFERAVGQPRRQQRARDRRTVFARQHITERHRGQHGEKPEHVVARPRARRAGRQRRQARQRQQREQRRARHQPGHRAVHLAPGPAAALRRIGPDQRDATRHDHRQPVAQHVERRAEPALGGAQQVGAVGVDHHVLRRRHERHRQRQQRKGLQRVLRRRGGQQQQREREPELCHHQPAAPAPEPRQQLEAVHQRRPQELEGVRQADQAQEADGRDVDALDAQPRLQRLAGQRQRQPRCEAEHADDEQAVCGDRARSHGRNHRQGRHRPILGTGSVAAPQRTVRFSARG